MGVAYRIDVSLLEPQFAKDINDLLASSPHTWIVTSGFRSIAKQTELYNKYKVGGPLAAPPGKSAHNYGLAVDITLVDDGKDVWDVAHPGWIWLIATIAKTPRLHSGASFGDYDHIERYQWKLHIDKSIT